MWTIRRLIRTGILGPLRAAIPARKRIGYDLLLARATHRLEEELIHLDRITSGGSLAVDVGANQGYYSYSLSRRFHEVHAFEPNTRLADELERQRPANVQVHNIALSSAVGELDLFIPLVDGVEQHGWASFDPGNLSGARDFRILKVPVRRLDDFALGGVAFVKIDVEGHELKVLEGALDTLRRNQPIVLIEIKRANRDAAFALFADLGYAPWRLHAGGLERIHDLEEEGENFVFRPESSTTR
jgi:FkbM family methyltransferase